MFIGKDLLPKSNAGELEIRIKEPEGTRLEKTERTVKGILNIIDSTVNGHVAISSAYVGFVPSSYGTSNLYIFNSGTNEALMELELDRGYKVNLDKLKDRLRENIYAGYPGVSISFEPIELTEKIMAQGAATPIEVRVAGKNFENIKDYSQNLVNLLREIPYLRDVQIAQPLHFPTINMHH